MAPLSPSPAEAAAPEWFARALAEQPERRTVEAKGARIETLLWGPEGAPGLIFLHGNGAHAEWWSFIAPFFARERRVVALSFSGMGASDWRDGYTSDTWVDEVEAVARNAGVLGDGARPIIAGHSMGAAIALACAGRFGADLAAVVLMDAPFRTPERMRQWRERRATQPPPSFPQRFYPDLKSGMARFRFMPAQPCEHPAIMEHIARHSLHETPMGWTWRFDPQLWRKMAFSDLNPVLADPGCPVAFVHGERSRLVDGEDLAHMWSMAPAGSPVVMVPDADHHLMVDQPLAFVAALRGLLAGWPGN